MIQINIQSVKASIAGMENDDDVMVQGRACYMYMYSMYTYCIQVSDNPVQYNTVYM